ncbi:hypothetical protein FIT72_04140 [Candidatus Methylopumilus universalis]|jgi:hypothetical protein|uniref:hypothetical protein n=1 Tax=Candidatus Methylopumilus universalis TaxID=2588536 RepID=UPI00111D4609|nr:hypothetical protein [Candidatus Methylopumilus universalis]QDC70740.1 hypothetical protein FIT72_04140 [Candidatus Methylopumilus universalis]
MNQIIDQIMNLSYFKKRPPVFLDIGASGSIYKEWEPLAKYSYCIAFDADKRDFRVTTESNKKYKKIFIFNSIVKEMKSYKNDFFLTNSPHCSSTLKPLNLELNNWAFGNLFLTTKILKLPSITIFDALKYAKLDYIDWFKSDSQGIDLRLFKSLTSRLRDKILAVEFEPGIINAYKGEDKLYEVLAYMQHKDFWISDMKIKGSHRIDQTVFKNFSFFKKRFIDLYLTKSPGWCEISYLNSLQSSRASQREFLLLWIISSIKNQHGFALSIAEKAKDRFDDEIFTILVSVSKKYMRLSFHKLTRKIINKFYCLLKIR